MLVNTFGKIEKLYINTTSTRIIQRYKKDYIEYNNQNNSKKSHIHLRTCDAASSYHCPSPIVGSNIPKWDCILHCCYDCPGMNAPDLE